MNVQPTNNSCFIHAIFVSQVPVLDNNWYPLDVLKTKIENLDPVPMAQTIQNEFLRWIKQWALYSEGDMSYINDPNHASQEYIYAQNSGQTIGIYCPEGWYKIVFPNCTDILIRENELNAPISVLERKSDPEVQNFIDVHRDRVLQEQRRWIREVHDASGVAVQGGEPTVEAWLITVMRNKFIPWIMFVPRERHFYALVFNDDIQYPSITFTVTRTPVTDSQKEGLKQAREQFKTDDAAKQRARYIEKLNVY